jgi:hypothetical protein
VDTREFKRLEQPADFRQLENYVDSVNPAEVGLKRVVQPYYLRSFLRCSLTTCHQEHHEGYLVELLDGRVSNIGHVCGSRPENFGESFSIGVARLSEANIRKDASRRLQDRAGIVERFNKARQLVRQLQLWQPRLNTVLLKFNLGEPLRRRLDRGERTIVEARERTPQEITDLVESGRFPNRSSARYFDQRIGEIQGLEAIHQPFEIASMLDASDALRTIAPLDMSTQDLVLHVRKDELVRAQMALIETWLRDVQRFLTKKNFALLARLIPAQQQADVLSKLTIEQLDATIQAELARSNMPKAGNATAANGPGTCRARKVTRHARRAAAQVKAAKPFID